MTCELTLIEKIDRSVVKITMNRPEKHNALNLEVMQALCEKIKTLESSGYKVLILAAAGSNFCTGMDLKQGTDETLMEKMGEQLAQLFRILYETPLVTIAAVQGHALAGGGGLAASCDILLFEEEAKIGFPETRRGLVAAQVAAILARQLSMRHIRGLLLTGKMIDSDEAVKIGLGNDVAPAGKLQEEAIKLAREVLKGGPEAIKETKLLLRRFEARDFVSDLKTALEIHHKVRHSEEGMEGVAAFLEKRAPKWSL